MRSNGETEELTTKTEIETACMEENNKKYTQTYDTPCMKLPLRRLLEFDGNTPMGRDILLGNFETPGGISPYTNEFFRQLKYADLRTERPKAIISSEDFRNGWKKMKENTSAGISGLHFGHMKTCAMDKSLSEFEASLCHIPFTTSYSPDKWRTNVSVMIKRQNELKEMIN